MESESVTDPAQSRFALSVIIPTLNESASIAHLLDTLAQLDVEILVVDGGSDDDTCDIARSRGVEVVSAPRGRGQQMRCGAEIARAPIFWFLHADTLPPPDAITAIAAALQDPGIVGGCFSVRFDGDRLSARFLTTLYRHVRRFGLCYGDSAYYVRREYYQRAGGFRDLPIFEDLDLLSRLKRLGRFVQLREEATTSSRRFAGRRFLGTFLAWVVLQTLYWLGVPARTLGRLYRPIRGKRA